MKSKTRYPYNIYLIESWKVLKVPATMDKKYLKMLLDLDNEEKRKNKDTRIELNMYWSAIFFFEHTLSIKEPQKIVSLLHKMKTSILSKEYESNLYNRFKSHRQVAIWIQDLAFQQIFLDIARTLNAYKTNEDVAILFQHKDFIEKKANLFMEGEIKLNQLKILAEGMLEATKNAHPIIRPVTKEDQTLLKRIEEITDEVKKTKRLTFKSAEEIKQLLNDSSESIDVQEVQAEERQNYISTIIQTYDVLFHLDRMLRKTHQEQLALQVNKNLKNIEQSFQEIGLEAIEALGKKINLELMEGVSTSPSHLANGAEQFSVIDELEKGFRDVKIGRVIRLAKVITVLN